MSNVWEPVMQVDGEMSSLKVEFFNDLLHLYVGALLRLKPNWRGRQKHICEEWEGEGEYLPIQSADHLRKITPWHFTPIIFCLILTLLQIVFIANNLIKLSSKAFFNFTPPPLAHRGTFGMLYKTLHEQLYRDIELYHLFY